jgi:hypothetical protein
LIVRPFLYESPITAIESGHGIALAIASGELDTIPKRKGEQANWGLLSNNIETVSTTDLLYTTV